MPRFSHRIIFGFAAAVFIFGLVPDLRADDPELLDTAPAQVAIKAHIARVDRGFLNSLGRENAFLKPVYDAGFRAHIDIEGSETIGLSGQHNGTVFQGRLFDYLNNRPDLNQIDIKFYRPINLRDDKFNIGGMLDVGYGRDFSFVHANGILDLHTYKSFTDPKYQFAFNQANIQVGLPFMKGAVITAGEWANPFGVETIDPADGRYSVLSPGYIQTFGLPRTQTGVQFAFAPCEKSTVYAGINRGWDQGLNDNNSSIDGTLGMTHSFGKSLHLNAGGTIGDELPNDNHDLRGMINASLCFDPCRSPFSCAVDWMYYYQHSHDEFFNESFNSSVTGFAFYSQYRICQRVSLLDRLEWYHDPNGLSLQVPNGNQMFIPPQRNFEFSQAGRSYELYDFTLGCKINVLKGRNVPKVELIPQYGLNFSDRKIFGQNFSSTSYTQQTLSLEFLTRF